MRNKLFVAVLALLIALPLCGAGSRRRVERPAVLLVEGTVTAVTSTSMSIRTPEGPSMTISVTAATEVERGMADVALTSLENGAYVTARVEQAAGGLLTALEIHVHSAPPSAGNSETIRIAGTVASVGVFTFQLKTERGLVTVNADTTSVVRRAGETIAFDAIRPGDNIVVAGKIVGEATIFALAIEILLEPVPPPAPPVPSIYGNVSTIGASEMTVVVSPPDPRMGMPTRLVTVRVDAKTVTQKNGEAYRFAAIREGDPVVVYGLFADDHTMLASRIDVLDSKPSGDVRGRVLEISGDDIVIEPDMPMPMAAPLAPRLIVRVSTTTEIWRDGARVRSSDIHAGDFIEAAGDWIDPTTLAAKKIAILPPPLARVSGSVVSVGDHTLQLREAGPSSDSRTIEIRADAKTEIFADGVAISFDAIKAGDTLSAAGTLLPEGAILARRVDVMRVPVPSWISGTVREVRGNDIVVAPGMTPPGGTETPVIVRVDERTTIMKNNRVVTVADIAAGDHLEASGDWIETGVLLATKIAIVADEPQVMKFFGRVTAINGFDLSVEPAVGMMDMTPGSPSMVVRATDATAVTNHGTPASFGMIATGFYIHAIGQSSRDGVLLATAIDITDPPPPPVTTIAGSVVEVREHEFVVAFPSFAYPSVTATVRVTATTPITRDGVAIRLSDLKVGEQVYAAGTWIADGIFVAAKVAVRTEEPPPPPPPFEIVSGDVAKIEGATLWLHGGMMAEPDVAVVTGPDTKFVKNGLPSDLTQVRVGDKAKASGTRDDEGRLKAFLVEVMTPRM